MAPNTHSANQCTQLEGTEGDITCLDCKPVSLIVTDNLQFAHRTIIGALINLLTMTYFCFYMDSALYFPVYTFLFCYFLLYESYTLNPSLDFLFYFLLMTKCTVIL